MMEIADSDDSDDLEDTPDFIKINTSKQNEVPTMSGPQEGYSRLDELLSEHKQEKAREEKRKTREEILSSIKEQEMKERLPNSPSQRSTELIEQMNNSVSLTAPDPAGLDIFNPDEQCCLFTEHLKPSECGFQPTQSPVDRLLESVTPNSLSSILLSKAFNTCLAGSQQADQIKTWLFYIMSIHSSATVTQFCYVNLRNLNQQCKPQSLTSEPKADILWWPRASDLLRVIVNWGANPDILLGEQTFYSPIEISDYLTSVTSEKCPDQLDLQLRQNNLAKVLNVLSDCLQVRPQVTPEELDLMCSMLAITSLDVSLHSCLAREHQVCLNSIVECYPTHEWPTRISRLCRLLLKASDHPADQAHLAQLLTSRGRGEELQISFSYLCLHRILCPLSPPPSDQVLANVELSDLVWLGEWSCPQEGTPLVVRMKQLVSTDHRQMTWVLQLLDLCVGSDHRRTSAPRKQLEDLIAQIKILTKSIRDNINLEHLSKIKDALSRMKVKWSLTFKTRKPVQRSIFSWASHAPVKEQPLQDQQLPNSDLEDEVLE